MVCYTYTVVCAHVCHIDIHYTKPLNPLSNIVILYTYAQSYAHLHQPHSHLNGFHFSQSYET